MLHSEYGDYYWRYHVRHSAFIDIALERFSAANDAYIELMNQENENPDGRTYELRNIICNNCIETVCFSVMALESYINTFSAAYISESFAESIDRLDIPAKWVVTMKVYFGLNLEKGSAPLQKIHQCTRVRNSYIHSKSKPVHLNENGGVTIPGLNLKEAYMIPAYDALMAIEDARKWISQNCSGDILLNIAFDDYSQQIKKDFLNTDNTWIFQEESTMF